MHPALLVIAWTVAILSVGYMLPWAVAITRQQRDTKAIFALNLLLGWTIVGWVVALVWALKS